MHIRLALAIGALFATSSLQARVDPSALKPQVGLGYRPEALDERGLWQDCDRLEEEIASSNLRIRDPALQTYVEGVMARLLGPQAHDVRVYIVHDPSFNASMFPNGMTIVHSGLLARVRNEAELAAVLGHESGHYLLRHTVARQRDYRTKSAILAFVQVGGALGAGVSAQTGGNPRSWIDLANSINTSLAMSLYSFSREQESQADAYGLKLMANAGYEPDEASAVWQALIGERKASAAARSKSYRSSWSALSTHPPDEVRFTDLSASSAEIKQTRVTKAWATNGADWSKAITLLQPSLIEEQVKLNDPGASLFLIESLAQNNWTATLRYYQGEAYRLRDAPGDAALADEAYAKAIDLPGAPAEAWRQHGYSLIKAGHVLPGHAALQHYLELKPAASDAGMVRFTLGS